MHAIVKSALGQAVKWEILPRNPAAVVKGPKVGSAAMQTYDLDQTAELHETYKQLPILLRNDGGKLTEVSRLAGPGFQEPVSARGLAVARILIPTRLLRAALRDHKYDVPALQAVFSTASMEAVAARLLDLDEPCVIAVVDDGVVASRRGNRMPASRKLEAAEQECLDRVMELDLPHRTRTGGWTAWGWPVPDRPFRRIILRAVPDDV